jgi:formyltetrahydrofolate synthetase
LCDSHHANSLGEGKTPGSPEHPAAEQVDVDAEGEIIGLF